MKRIAVVGASGFVGSAVVEHLISQENYEIVPLIHNSGNALRIARLGISPQSLNVLVRDEVETALNGCTHVINCSRGDETVMLQGLRNLLAASHRKEIRRFVHLSSVLVYGDPPPNDSKHEDGRTEPKKGTYGSIKLRQDQLIMKASSEGLSSVILCPPNISGPYSEFLLQLLNAMRISQFALMGDGSAPCNLIDVSNLVGAIELALSKGKGDGTRIFVTDDEKTKWHDVVEGLAPLADLKEPVPTISKEELSRICAAQEESRASLLKSMKHLVSSNVRAAMRKDPFWAKIDQAARRGIGMLGHRAEERLRLLIEGPTPIQEVKANPHFDTRLCAQQLRGVRHSCDRAKRELDYRPLHSFSESMDAFRVWYRTLHGMDSGAWDLLRELY
jgi:nucleoside-diphosphate-sugar epimerase